MYNIIITEKPSVAREYVKVLKLSESDKKDGYVEGKSAVDGRDYRITWAVGHLVTLSYPEVYDENLKKWSMDTLPFLPESYKYEVLKDTKKQYSVIRKLYNDKDIETIYYAGDSGREGIYIQMLIRMAAGHSKGVSEKVVWIDSQTEAEILRGIKEAKPLSAYQNLIHAAYMRAIEDYAIGINFSRALSCKFGYAFNKEIASAKYKPISVGRVMTCVLGMIVKREREIKDFKETVFYRVSALCGDFTAKWKAIEGTRYFESPDVYNNEGFLQYSNANAFKGQLETNPVLTVTKAESKTEKKNPPMLYNLAEIQNDCSKLFKLSPDETLEAIQALYERKLVTYPRTDARVLSTAIAKEIDKNLRGLAKKEYKKDIAENILNSKTYIGLEKTKYCDDSKITDHYAIIPTGEGDADALKGIHVDVYQLIIRRFLSIFYPAAEYKKVELELKHSDNEYFYVSDKILKKRGYMEVTGEGEILPDSKLMSVKEGDTVNAAYQITEGKTTPPKRYTSGSMILAMENAGNLIEDEELRNQIKSCGIGTSATRGGIIKKLCENSYITLEKKTQILKPLIAGEKIYDIVDDNLQALLSPQMTASWEKGLSQIEEGKVSREVYQQKLDNYIRAEVESIKAKEAEQKKPFESKSVCKCPWCGGDVVTTPYGFKCENHSREEGSCPFSISQVSGRLISEKEVKDLLEKGRTEVLDGFKSKAGRKFSAAIVLNKEEKKISFEFPEKEAEETKLICPKCGEHLKKEAFSMTCNCGFKISHVVAKKKLTDKQMQELLAGRTELIKGFTSKAGKKFDAYLTFDGEKTSFEFPERKG